MNELTLIQPPASHYNTYRVVQKVAHFSSTSKKVHIRIMLYKLQNVRYEQ